MQNSFSLFDVGRKKKSFVKATYKYTFNIWHSGEFTK